jgi:hypothetical protein
VAVLKDNFTLLTVLEKDNIRNFYVNSMLAANFERLLHYYRGTGETESQKYLSTRKFLIDYANTSIGINPNAPGLYLALADTYERSKEYVVSLYYYELYYDHLSPKHSNYPSKHGDLNRLKKLLENKK